MKNELVKLEVAKLAREKGFIPVEETMMIASLDDSGGYPAPQQSLLQRWLREVHELWIYVRPKKIIDKIVWINNVEEKHLKKGNEWAAYHKTWELALEAGLIYALKAINDD